MTLCSMPQKSNILLYSPRYGQTRVTILAKLCLATNSI